MTPADYGFLHQLESSPETLSTWRLRGQAASPEQVIASLWDGALAVFLVERRANAQPCGVVSLYGASFRHRFAYFAVLGDPRVRGSGTMVEATALLISFAFRTYDLRKLYAETTDEAAGRFGSAIGKYLIEEGRLRRHWYVDGRYVDQLMLAIDQESWDPIEKQWPWLTGTGVPSLPNSVGPPESLALQDLLATHGVALPASSDAQALRLNLDSLELLELAAALEMRLDRTLSDDLIASWQTWGDVIALLE